MANPQERNEILTSLRPIFPQLGDHELVECVESVRRTVGESRELVIPGCIDLLLARAEKQENNPARDYPGMAIVIEDEIPSHEVNRNNSSFNGTSEEKFFEDVDDDELMYVATSVQRGDVEIFMIDDSPPLCLSPSKNTSRIPSTKKTNDRSNKHDISDANTTSSAPSTSGLMISPPSSTCPEYPITNPIKFCVEKITRLFPDVQENYLKELLEKWGESPLDDLINKACNYLLENGGYPKEEEKRTASNSSPPTKETQNTDYFKEFSAPTSYIYERQCLSLLEKEFPMVSVRDIRNIASKFNSHYAPTRKHLEEKVIEAHQSKPLTSTSSKGTSGSIRLLKTRRRQSEFKSFHLLVPELQKEIDFIKIYKINEAEEKDRQMAFVLNEKQYEEEGQKIECGCCYGEATFEDMIQCLDGHLFCIDCLRNYAKEAVFGQGKAMLSCMTSECDSTFPMSQLKKNLASNILSKYEDRLTEESLCLAEMDDLVRCPSCDFAAILPSEDKVFKCQNTSCLKETCRFCKEDWKEHFGLKCNEVEKKGAKDVRLSYEERMTMAKIRKCHKCGCEFTKSDGCNKMTCRCGTTMCYICRKPGISYAHFCQHPRDPGKKCHNCKNCSLWSDPSEDDDMAVKQLEREAEDVKRKAMDSSEGETPSKRPRTSNVNIHVGNLVQPIK